MTTQCWQCTAHMQKTKLRMCNVHVSRISPPCVSDTFHLANLLTCIVSLLSHSDLNCFKSLCAEFIGYSEIKMLAMCVIVRFSQQCDVWLYNHHQCLGHIQDCKRARILKEKRQKRKVVTHAKAHITHIFYINCSLFFHQFGYIYLPIQLKIMGCPFSFTTLICFLVTGWYQHRTYKYSVWNKYLWWKTEIVNRQIAEIRPSLIACLFVCVCVCVYVWWWFDE